jgi:soluble lytic murein transglycosylase-like protein
MKSSESARLIAARQVTARDSAAPTRRSNASSSSSVAFEYMLGRGLQAQRGASASKAGRAGPASGAPASSGRASVAPASAAAYRPLVEQTARKYGLDPALLFGVIESESGFNPRAVSSAGAKGLMQLMDGTARGYGVADPYSPQQNVDAGARFLRDLLRRYDGSTSLALAAYNAGPGAVDRYGGVPPYQETRTYVARVQAATKRYAG